MAANSEQLDLDFYVNYKQLKSHRKEWIYSPIYSSRHSATVWRLQIDNSDATKIGIYLTLVKGSPCILQSYKIYILTNTNPSLMIFPNQCTERRTFPCDEFSWGFENVCSRRSFKAERKLICDPKTKTIHVRCTLFIDVTSIDILNDDHRLATDLFSMRTLDQWIEFLKEKNDLPELNNKVNQELEKRLHRLSLYS